MPNHKAVSGDVGGCDLRREDGVDNGVRALGERNLENLARNRKI
jgi:hypothetical protein